MWTNDRGLVCSGWRVKCAAGGGGDGDRIGGERVFVTGLRDPEAIGKSFRELCELFAQFEWTVTA